MHDGLSGDPEQQQLRRSVAEVAGRYGLEYYVKKAKAGERTTEVWEEAGRIAERVVTKGEVVIVTASRLPEEVQRSSRTGRSLAPLS